LNAAVLKYRPDIDGLRALAVVPVVLFHADVALFSGGFIGVDVFFVISGYLITAMLLQDIVAKRFSLLDFYARRARRILPALLAVVAVTLLASFFLLLPNELAQAAKAARRIAVFTSNHLFWQTQNDYWQQNALANQPLLHTWSLAVEEQFYLVMPLLLCLCVRLKQRPGILIALLGVVSLALSQYWSHSQPAAAFYLLPSRAFELLIGALLAVLLRQENKQTRVVNQCLASLGLVFIVAAIFLYHDHMPFPGVAALLPCLGAAAIIYAGATQHPARISWVNRLLAMRGLVIVGLISYSLYLWHWPILVLVRSLGWYARGLPEIPMGVVVAGIFAVSWASWRWIELPFRAKRLQTQGHGKDEATFFAPILRKRQRVALLGTVAALVACWGLGSGIRHFPQPLPSILAEFAQDTSVTPGVACEGNPDARVIRAGVSGCLLGDLTRADTPAFAILGDSHARMWAAGLDTLGAEHQQSILMLAYSSCTPLLGYVPPTRHECAAILRAALDYLVHAPVQKVVLAGYWVDAISNMKSNEISAELFKSGLKASVKILQEAGKSIYIMTDIPELDSAAVLHKKILQSLRNENTTIFHVVRKDHENRQREVGAVFFYLQNNYGVQVLDPSASICPDLLCAVAENGKTLYRDKHHITDSAAQKFRGIFKPALEINSLHVHGRVQSNSVTSTQGQP